MNGERVVGFQAQASELRASGVGFGVEGLGGLRA